jgi:hypothetical protein
MARRFRHARTSHHDNMTIAGLSDHGGDERSHLVRGVWTAMAVGGGDAAGSYPVRGAMSQPLVRRPRAALRDRTLSRSLFPSSLQGETAVTCHSGCRRSPCCEPGMTRETRIATAPASGGVGQTRLRPELAGSTVRRAPPSDPRLGILLRGSAGWAERDDHSRKALQDLAFRTGQDNASVLSTRRSS